MSLPIVDSISFDKPSYAPTDTVTVTISYHGTNPDGGTSQTFNFTGSVTDTTTGEVGTGTGSFTIATPGTADPLKASGSDDGGHDWTVVSDDGVGTAVLSAPATVAAPAA